MSCLHFDVIFIFEVVFIFEVGFIFEIVFIFEVIFIFEVVFIFRGCLFILSHIKNSWVCHCSAKVKNPSLALLSPAYKSECGDAQPSWNIWVWHCSANLKNLSVALLSLANKSECGTAQSCHSQSWDFYSNLATGLLGRFDWKVGRFVSQFTRFSSLGWKYR